MTGALVEAKSVVLESAGDLSGMPSMIVHAGAEKRFLEFFAAQIRNRNTREAYLLDVRDFLGWAEVEAGIADLSEIEPVHVADRVELKTRSYEAQSVKQQLAALRHLFDWLVRSRATSCTPTRPPSSGDRNSPTPGARRRS